MTDGAFANFTGDVAERVIKCILSDRGYHIQHQYTLCESIYGHKIRTDFFIDNIKEFPNGLAIECKWQDTGGSADEKFPYLVINIKNQFPCPVIVVIGGNGHKPGSVTWLSNQVDKKKLLAVFTIEEFISWVNREMPDPSWGWL